MVSEMTSTHSEEPVDVVDDPAAVDVVAPAAPEVVDPAEVEAAEPEEELLEQSVASERFENGNVKTRDVAYSYQRRR